MMFPLCAVLVLLFSSQIGAQLQPKPGRSYVTPLVPASDDDQVGELRKEMADMASRMALLEQQLRDGRGGFHEQPLQDQCGGDGWVPTQNALCIAKLQGHYDVLGARESCGQLGGSVFRAGSPYDQTILVSAMQDVYNDSGEIWIDVVQSDPSFQGITWAPGFPILASQNATTCTYMVATSAVENTTHLYNANCTEEKQVICQKPIIGSVQWSQDNFDWLRFDQLQLLSLIRRALQENRCEDDWSDVPGGLCLVQVQRHQDFVGADEACRSMLATVYQVNSPEDQEILVTFLNETFNRLEDTWVNPLVLETGEVPHANWAPGFPKELGPNSACVYMSPKSDAGDRNIWENDLCSAKKGVVCQKPQTASLKAQLMDDIDRIISRFSGFTEEDNRMETSKLGATASDTAVREES